MEVFHIILHMIVCQDFNINFGLNNNEANLIRQLFLSYDLYSHVTGTTRPNNSNGTQIDNIFSNIPEDTISCSVFESDISDHFSQILDINNNTYAKISYARKRFYTESNIARFKEALSSERWHEVYRSPDVNTKYKIFYDTLYYHFDISFPLTTSRARSCERGWISNEIKNYSAYVRDLYMLYKQTNCNNVLNKYKQEKRAYKKYLSIYKKTINDSKISASNNK